MNIKAVTFSGRQVVILQFINKGNYPFAVVMDSYGNISDLPAEQLTITNILDLWN